MIGDTSTNWQQHKQARQGAMGNSIAGATAVVLQAIVVDF